MVKDRYAIYGLSVESSAPIPAASPSCFWVRDIELTFHPSDAAEAETANRVIYTGPSVSVYESTSGYHFAYQDGTKFRVSRQANLIAASIPEGLTVSNTCTYLFGPVMRLVLRIKGVVSLHASSVLLRGRAVAFCGPPGAGKSTSVAALAQLGYPVLAEDVAALDDQCTYFRVQPGYPRVNLWPESAAALCGSAETFPAITPNWGKRYLPLDDSNGLRFHCSPAPLAAIYVLGERREQSHPEFEPLHSVEALIALASNTYTPYLLDEAMRAREFDVLTRLVKHVPVRRVYPPCDFSNISHFCEGLLNDFASLP